MGFWNNLGNMIQGKPVFTGSPAPENQPLASAPLGPQRQKIRPIVEFKQVKCRVNGPRMQATAWITNTSPFEVELDRLDLLNSYSTDLNLKLRPGQGREVRIYDGPVMQNDQNHRSRLRYKIAENGDYFEAQFYVEFYRESDGVYRIEDLNLEQSPRDI